MITWLLLGIIAISQLSLQSASYPELIAYPYLVHRGLIPYVSLIDQHFPGILLLPINLYTLGFKSEASMKVLSMITVLFSGVWIKKISKSNMALLTYTITQPVFEGTHTWIESMLGFFLLPGFYFNLKRRWILSGLCIGVAIIFKQTVLPLALIVGIQIFSRYGIKSTLRYGIAMSTPVVGLLVYYLSKNTFSNFVYWTMTFNLTTYASQAKLLPNVSETLLITGPFILIVVAYLSYRNLRVLVIWILFLTVFGISRFGLVHLQPALPFFSILLAKLTKKYSRLVMVVFLFLISVSIKFYSTQTNLFTYKYFGETEKSLTEYISISTSISDKIFLLGVNPHIYAHTNRIPPDNYFVYQLPWYFSQLEDEQLEKIKADPPKLIVYDPQSSIDGKRLKQYGAKLVNYLEADYLKKEVIGPYHIYARRY